MDILGCIVHMLTLQGLSLRRGMEPMVVENVPMDDDDEAAIIFLSLFLLAMLHWF